MTRFKPSCCLVLGGLLLSPLWCNAETDQENKMYRWKGGDGSVVFSSSPPPPGVEASEMTMPQPANVTPSQDLNQLMERNRQIERELDQASQQRNAAKDRIEAVQQRLNEARQAAKDGEVPLPGERQKLPTGANRLTPAYFERQDMLRKRVDALEEELAQLRRQLR